MKICIVTTPIRPKPTIYPPFGSMAIVQSLREINQNVHFYHIDYFRYSHDQIVEYFTKNQFDMVGISAVVSTAYEYTKYLTKVVKKINNKTLVFLGGGLAASAEILHKKANVDYCVFGDGEIIAQNLITAVSEKKTNSEDLKKIKGISFMDENNKFIFTGYDHPLPADMIRRPDFNILKEINCLDYYLGGTKDMIKKFTNTRPNLKVIQNPGTAVVVVAKGCVARCTFCHRFEKGYRVSPKESIIEHMKMLRDKYNVRYIIIGDENFGSYKKETIDLVSEMGKLGFIWKASGVRAHTVNYEMLKFWKDNGCIGVDYGIESGSPTMLKVMEKKITLEQNIKALKETYQAGLETLIQLVIGMPGETDKTIKETIDFVKELMPYYPNSLRNVIDNKISINYAQALPSTPLYEYAREHGFIENTLEAEEKYLLDISDKEAYSNEHFINYTKQPLLKVLSWRYYIYWDVWREHAKLNLKLDLSKTQTFISLIIMSLNKIFKLKLNNPANIAFNKINEKFNETRMEISDDFYNTENTSRLGDTLRWFMPWNKLTYPFIVTLVAFKESKDNNRSFFKMIYEHLKWSFSNSKLDLPQESLRKVVKLDDADPTVEIRKGR